MDISVVKGECKNNGYPYEISVTGTEEGYKLESVAVIELEYNERPKKNYYLIIDFENNAVSTVVLYFNFYKKGELIAQMSDKLVCGRRVKSAINVKYLDGSTVFPKMLPGQLKCMEWGKPTNINEIDKITVDFREAKNMTSIKIYDVYFTETLPDMSIKGEPYVDELGQNKTKDFRGKFYSKQEMVDYLNNQYIEAEKGIEEDKELDKFGGYKKLNFGATGHFYTHFDGNRRWLVTPLGNAFFSNGVCYGTRTGIYGIIDSFENLFEKLPDRNDKLFKKAYAKASVIPEYVKRNGEEAGKSVNLFNFMRANMMTAFGEEWFLKYAMLTSYRLKKWGFNTISVCVNEYEDEQTQEFLKIAKIPYCITLKHFPKTYPLIFRDFPDVFSAEYRNECMHYAKQLCDYMDDEYFIGYFLTNEPEWWFAINKVNIAERCFANKESTASKRHLLTYLKEKYVDVEKLNLAWESDFRSFEDLEKPLENLDALSQKASEDFEIMKEMLIEKYCSVPSDAAKEIAPFSLNLGMRYSGVSVSDENSEAFKIKENFDVLSFNCYTDNPTSHFEMADKIGKMPFVVGEWHFGSLEGGMLASATIATTNDEERGKACAMYLARALENKSCVGVHYFELNDQPLLGRFDGENMQIGLVNVCGRPYDDCVKLYSSVGNDKYKIATGEKSSEKMPFIRTKRF